MDQVDDQRVPTQRKKRSRHYRRLVLRNRGPSAITVHHVPEEQPDQDDAEPGQQRPVIRHYHALWYDTERQEQEALRVEVLGQYVLAGGEYEGAEHEVGEPKSQKRVGQDYGDPDQVQYAESHNAYPEG